MAAGQPAPAPAQETPTIKVTTEEVILDLIVRDKKGKPVKDLTSEQVEVTDNGVKQKITGFRLVEGREAVEKGTRIPLDAMKQIRLVTLVFEVTHGSRADDDRDKAEPPEHRDKAEPPERRTSGVMQTTNLEARRIARQAALDLVKGDQGQNVFYSVFAIQNQLYPLQAFTTNRDLLKQAIELATSGQFTRYAAEAQKVRGLLRQQMSGTLAAGPATAPAIGNAPGSSPGAANQQQVTAMGSAQVEQRLAEIMSDMSRLDQMATTESTRVSIFSLLSLVRGQYPMPGRKSILYFSEGLWIPPQLDEPFRSVLSTANRANVTFYAVDTRGVGASNNSGAVSQMREAARISAEDVTRTDGIVSKEAITASDTAELSMRDNVQLPLRDLSESTGGFLVGESNDLRTALRQVNEEVNSYYEIAYNPGLESYDGSFRKTHVDLNRKDVNVHARSGYFALPANVRGAAVLPYEFALLKALGSVPLPKEVEFRSSALRFRPDPDGTHGMMLVEVPMGGVTFTPDEAKGTYKARLSAVALIKNQAGEVVQKFSRDLPLSGPISQIPQVKAGNFIYKEQLDLGPGRYTVEAAVMDHEANKFAARKTALVMPPKPKGVAISSLSLVRNYQPNAKDLQPDDPFQFQGGRITPTLGGTVYAVKGAQLSTFFIVYPDPSLPDKPQLTVEYLVDGQSVGKGEVPLPAADAKGQIPYVMSSPAEKMPPATYQIKAVVKQGSTVAEESTFVTVAAPK